VPKYQFATSATYGSRFGNSSEWFVSASWQRVGNRYTQPADQENNPRTFVSGLASTAPRDRIDADQPAPAAYDLVNLSAGLDFDSGLGRASLRQQPVRRERPCCRSTVNAGAAPASATTSAVRARLASRCGRSSGGEHRQSRT
jgi:hypothetical protein